MKKLIATVIIITMSMTSVFATTAFAQEVTQTAQRIIEVNGKGIVSAKPDVASIYFTVESKEKTAENFAKLYSLLPELTKKSEVQVLKIDILEVKSNIINAYASIESKSWEKAESEVSKAEKSMEIVMSDISKKEDQRKYNINKIYIQIEEIKNSLSTKEAEIFYIKYKNLIQELNTIL